MPSWPQVNSLLPGYRNKDSHNLKRFLNPDLEIPFVQNTFATKLTQKDQVHNWSLLVTSVKTFGEL